MLLISGVSCGGVRDYLPHAPALSEARAARWLEERNQPLVQAPPEELAVPVPPLQFFAVYYEQDIVIETQDPRWSMHEYARVRIGDETVWMAKDSDPKGVQTATADVDHLEQWLPEVPIPRRSGPVRVEDRSEGDTLDVTLSYRNPLGDETHVEFRATQKSKLERKRNGSTFDHSQQAASVLLDVRRRQTKAQAAIRYGDTEPGLRKVLGLVAVKALLEQLQAGIAAASMHVRLQSGGLSLVRPHPGVVWPTRADESWTWEGSQGTGTLTHGAYGVRHRLRFERGGLAEARVEVQGLEGTALRFELSAPLPDATRPFEGPVERRFVMWVGGLAQGYGQVVATWSEGGTDLRVLPEAPYWFERRPVASRVSKSHPGYRVESRILDPKTREPREVQRDPVDASEPVSTGFHMSGHKRTGSPPSNDHQTQSSHGSSS